MLHCIRTNSKNSDFQKLVAELDAFLKIVDGSEHSFYSQYNKIDTLKYAILAYENEMAVGCGAIRKFSEDTAEVKRMYVLPFHRGKGIANAVLFELEKWASELGYKRCILETGHKQPEAISLYRKSGFAVIPNYGQYGNVTNSICFEKML